MAVVNISSVNVAFPSIREDFGSTDAELSWIVGAYNVVVGSLLLAAGRLSDSLGRRRVYLPGVAIVAACDTAAVSTGADAHEDSGPDPSTLATTASTSASNDA